MSKRIRFSKIELSTSYKKSVTIVGDFFPRDNTVQDYMIREEAARFLDISTRTLDRYVQRKIIKPHRRGKRTMFLRADLEALANTPGAQQPHVSTSSVDVPAEQNPQLAALIALAQEMHTEIGKKDQEIKHLSFELGKYQEIAKNSVPLLESRKQELSQRDQISLLERSLLRARFGRQVFVALFGVALGTVGILVHYLFLSQ